MQENLDLFLNEFADQATLTQGVTSTSIKVIFDRQYAGGLDINVEGRSLIALCKTSDVGTVRHGHTLTLATKVYTIVGVQPVQDGKFTELVLRE